MKVLLVTLLTLFISTQIYSQKVKNFTLQSVTNDKEFTLNEAKGRYIALHFLLKTECPVCMRHTMNYYNRAGELPNVEQLFIKPDTDAEIQEWADDLSKDDGIDITIYQDKEAQLARKFKIPHGYFFHKQLVHYPAFILLNEKGKEVFRYVGKNNRDRYSFDQLVEKMNKINN
ncbi:peroxiredoxin family protein [Reichenbachiella versicolor]|uniref:peroxiredoxin family protein n=1 Tax=Reichenbachiella versicolor TaxID=1821036 RepID=UPI000D6E8E76|nr:redoxin domain-containing protein [Reichenbachiella versicolor]